MNAVLAHDFKSALLRGSISRGNFRKFDSLLPGKPINKQSYNTRLGVQENFFNSWLTSKRGCVHSEIK